MSKPFLVVTTRVASGHQTRRAATLAMGKLKLRPGEKAVVIRTEKEKAR